MSTTTTNYKLIKPALTDSADITAMNPNWDAIDTELKKKYDPNNKPTAADVDAVNKAGDTMTGALTTPQIIISNRDNPVELGRFIDLHKTGSDKDYDGRIFLSADDNSDLLFERIGIGGGKIYHTGNKPTATDVGAVKYEYYGGNMNDLVTDGHYRLNANVNLPGYAYYGQCIVSRGNDMDTVAQIVFGISTQGMVHYAIFRSGRFTSGAWVFEDWAQIATTDYAVSKSGDTMTGNLTIRTGNSPSVFVSDTERKRYGTFYIANDDFVGIQNTSSETKGKSSLWLAPETITDLNRLLSVSTASNTYRVLHTGNSNQTALVSTETTPTVNGQINWTYE